MKHYLNAMKNYATFSGRATRKEYWAVVGFLWLGIFIGCIGMLAFNPGLSENNETVVELFATLTFVWMLAHILPCISVSVRRLHDFDMSGWMYLLNFVPLANYVVWIVFGCISPTPGANRFGADPRGGASLADLEAFGDAPKPAFDPATGGLVRA